MALPATIDALRAILKALEVKDFDRLPVLSFGVPTLDNLTANGGLRLDSLHEVTGARATLRDDAASLFFTAGIAARAWGPVLWIARDDDLFAPDYAHAGLDPRRIIRISATRTSDVVALMEMGLGHKGLGAVVGEVGSISHAATRKIQAAAQSGQTIALLRRHHLGAGDDPLATPSAAVTRWRVADVSARSADTPMLRRRWSVTLAEEAGVGTGRAASVEVAACDRNGRCAALPQPRKSASIHPHVAKGADVRAPLHLIRSAA